MADQSNHAIYRVIVFRTDGSEVLLTHSHSKAQFPEVSIPQGRRVAECITSAMEGIWDEEVICLFEHVSSHGESKYRHIATRQARARAAPSESLYWAPVADLVDHSFTDPSDYRALTESVAQCRATIRDTKQRPFARLNWFEEVCEWVEQAISSRALHLTGRFRQMNASLEFSLIRFETTGHGVWFKAVGEQNKREFAITLHLTQFFPEYAPAVLASRADWSAWLSREIEGSSLAEALDLSQWKHAAESLAKLQIQSIETCDRLLHAGAHDLRLETLLSDVAPFMDLATTLMEEQSKTPPPILSSADLKVVEWRICDALSRLSQLDIPDTLGNVDLNPRNVFGSTNGCTFLDWAEAIVGHPFFSFQYLLEHFRHSGIADAQSEADLTSSYLAPWRRITSSETLSEAVALVPLVAPFAYASGTAGESADFKDPKLAGYLRALTRRMKREADQLTERMLCLMS